MPTVGVLGSAANGFNFAKPLTSSVANGAYEIVLAIAILPSATMLVATKSGTLADPLLLINIILPFAVSAETVVPGSIWNVTTLDGTLLPVDPSKLLAWIAPK